MHVEHAARREMMAGEMCHELPNGGLPVLLLQVNQRMHFAILASSDTVDLINLEKTVLNERTGLNQLRAWPTTICNHPDVPLHRFITRCGDRGGVQNLLTVKL